MFGKAQATSAVLQTMSPMNSPAPGTRATLLAVVAICAGLISTALVASAWETETQFSGRATGVFIHTAFFDTAFADTGELPPGGGTIDATFDIPVNALDLTLVTGERVIVSHAHSDIRCGRAEPSPKDFVTGGGFIDIAGGKANFGFVAGFKPHATAPSCQFTYIDHDAGIRVKMTDITDYGGSGTTRTFKGTAMVNGALDTATITVYDGGEPGRGVDTFRISLDSGYVADGTLAGGNIQLHA